MPRLPRYIDAMKLEELCEIMANKCDDGSGESIWNQFKTVVECSPTADVIEIKHGKWIDDKGLYRCSNCNHIWSELWWVANCSMERMYKIMRFCPNCGAEMQEEKGKDE